MLQLDELIRRVIERVNVNLREQGLDVESYARAAVQPEKLLRFYAFYGLTPHHPLHFRFRHSSLAGSYFLGKCHVDHSVVYKSDIRGDELKPCGAVVDYQGLAIPVYTDEVIRIRHSYLIKTLVHNYSHDPENLEEFRIQNTLSMPYANIHGSPVEGCFLGPFSTVDLTTLHNCVVGAYAYVQVGELAHHRVAPGRIWIRHGDAFDFSYSFPPDVLAHYISMQTDEGPRGVLMDFVDARKEDFEAVFRQARPEPPIPIPHGAACSAYAVVDDQTQLGENVLVAQRAYLQGAYLGRGSNAQENCFIIGSRLEGENVTAHGGKVIGARLGKRVFVGFNAFLRGTSEHPLEVGDRTIVMPHTIIDLQEPLSVPAECLVWGCIRKSADLAENSMSLERLREIRKGVISEGTMRFRGDGAEFVGAFERRIEHILEANGAYYDGEKCMGHAQKGQRIAFNTIEPYKEGDLMGIYPTIDIQP